jgi:hypothetical protein
MTGKILAVCRLNLYLNPLVFALKDHSTTCLVVQKTRLYCPMVQWKHRSNFRSIVRVTSFYLLKFLFLTPLLLANAIDAPQAAEKRRTTRRTGRRTTPADTQTDSAPTTDTSQTRRRQRQAEPPSLPVEDRNQPTSSGDRDIHLPAIPEASPVVSAIDTNDIQPGR